MSWAYSDWRSQATPALRLARLNLHLQELTDAVGRELAGDGKSKSENNIARLIELAEKEREKLQERVDRTGASGGVTQIRIRTPRGGGCDDDGCRC